MLRYLIPYLIVSVAVIAATAVTYGSGVVGIAGCYAGVIVSGAVLFVGYERWDDRQRQAQRALRSR